MSCACENKKIGSDLDRIRKLAKAFALTEQATVVLFQNQDGTYGFCPLTEKITKPIIEYISEY
ncbi:MAG: hypothetical protein HUK14_06025 [Muribaculaceae bacterium]|nr:hypothetical protein [Muribaculaceae bacterium]